MSNIFRPNQWQIVPWYDQSEVVLLSGKPGGGKSFLAGNKLHAYLLQYPGSTGLAMRKVREDMDQSVIPFMLNTVIDIDHEPRCYYHVRSDRIIYDNGSELFFRGMFNERQREGLKSIGQEGNVDFVWWEEGTDFEEEDFNYMITRIRGPAGKYRQHIISTNPLFWAHWINVRLIMGGEAAFYYSDWTMNPSIDGDAYGRNMARLTGTARARMYEGAWTSGIGLVVDPWVNRYHPVTAPEPTIGNVTVEADYTGEGRVLWTVDDGYAGEPEPKTGYFKPNSGPRAFIMAEHRPGSDTLAVFGVHYAVKKLYEPHILEVKKYCREMGWPEKPAYAVFDGASPTLGRYLKNAGIKPRGIRTKIEDGLDELRNWVGPDENGHRRLIVHPRCKPLHIEFGAYVYGNDGKPIDDFNHGIDALRGLTYYLADGEPEQATLAASGVDLEKIQSQVAAQYELAMRAAEERMAEAIRQITIGR